MRRCSFCLIEDCYPGVRLDSRGYCASCAEFEKIKPEEYARKNLVLERQLEDFIRRRRSPGRSGGRYDCVVALSGGKDSAFVVWLFAKKYGLRCLAATVDMGYLSRDAARNIAFVSRKLNIPHVYLRPPFLFKKVFAYAFKTDFFSKVNGLACHLCGFLISNLLCRLASDLKVPHVVSGAFSPENRVLFKDEESVYLEKEFPTSLLRYLRKTYARWFYSGSADRGRRLSIVLPLNVIFISEEEKMQILGRELGFGRRKSFAPPLTNCLVSLASIYLYRKKFGYNPYSETLGHLIRHGMYDRALSLKRLKELYANLDGPSSLRREINDFFLSIKIKGA